MQNYFYKDPIHQEISFEKEYLWLYELTQTSEFKRLNDIKQLGLSFHLFPGATGTRLLHSLGTYEIAKRIINNCDINKIYKKKSLIVLIASLLHDIGHGPHSHCFEKYMVPIEDNLMLHKKRKLFFFHEDFSKRIIVNKNGNIFRILSRHKIEPELVADLLFESKIESNDPWMVQLISSELDADRIDYLLKDSYYSGANYGIIDSQLLIKWTNFDKESKKIFYLNKAIPTLEDFLVRRFYMYLNVYNNLKSIAFEWQIRSIFSKIRFNILNNKMSINDSIFTNAIKPILVDQDPEKVKLNYFLCLNDSYLNNFFYNLQNVSDPLVKEFSKSYINGDLLFKIKNYDSKEARDKVYDEAVAKLKKNKPSDYKYLISKFDIEDSKIYSPKSESQKIFIGEVHKNGKNKLIDFKNFSNVYQRFFSKNFKKKHYIIYKKNIKIK